MQEECSEFPRTMAIARQALASHQGHTPVECPEISERPVAVNIAPELRQFEGKLETGSLKGSMDFQPDKMQNLPGDKCLARL